jgi:hypothetical protein
MRREVKVFDQSDGGLRIRSLSELEETTLYVQLDRSLRTLVRCSMQRKSSVARNCWEYGLEAIDLFEIEEVMPESVVRQYQELNTTPQVVASEIHLPQLESEQKSVDGQLDELLGLPVNAPLVHVPREEPPTPAQAEALPEITVATVDPPTAKSFASESSDIDATPTNADLTETTLPLPAKKSSERFEKCMTMILKASDIAGRLVLRGCVAIRKVVGDSVEPGSVFANKSEDEHRREWFEACAVKGEQSRID